MVTQDEILTCLSTDEWFRPSKTGSIKLKNGLLVENIRKYIENQKKTFNSSNS